MTHTATHPENAAIGLVQNPEPTFALRDAIGNIYESQLTSQAPTAAPPRSELGTSRYVVGFLFDDDGRRVVLIEKRKPAYQRGLLNGVGGSIETTDATEWVAMSREFAEEAGVGRQGFAWEKFLDFNTFNSIDGDKTKPAYVAFFRAFDSVAFELARTMTRENIHKIEVEDLRLYRTMPNLAWLIPMALRREPKLSYEMKEL